MKTLETKIIEKIYDIEKKIDLIETMKLNKNVISLDYFDQLLDLTERKSHFHEKVKNLWTDIIDSNKESIDQYNKENHYKLDFIFYKNQYLTSLLENQQIIRQYNLKLDFYIQYDQLKANYLKENKEEITTQLFNKQLSPDIFYQQLQPLHGLISEIKNRQQEVDSWNAFQDKRMDKTHTFNNIVSHLPEQAYIKYINNDWLSDKLLVFKMMANDHSKAIEKIIDMALEKPSFFDVIHEILNGGLKYLNPSCILDSSSELDVNFLNKFSHWKTLKSKFLLKSEERDDLKDCIYSFNWLKINHNEIFLKLIKNEYLFDVFLDGIYHFEISKDNRIKIKENKKLILSFLKPENLAIAIAQDNQKFIAWFLKNTKKYKIDMILNIDGEILSLNEKENTSVFNLGDFLMKNTKNKDKTIDTLNVLFPKNQFKYFSHFLKLSEDERKEKITLELKNDIAPIKGLFENQYSISLKEEIQDYFLIHHLKGFCKFFSLNHELIQDLKQHKSHDYIASIASIENLMNVFAEHIEIAKNHPNRDACIHEILNNHDIKHEQEKIISFENYEIYAKMNTDDISKKKPKL